MNDNIQIALGLDDNYVMQSGVAITSICINTNHLITFHLVLSGNVTDKSKETIRNLVNSYGNNIFFYDIDDTLFVNMPETMHINKAAYNRLLLSEILPQNITKVLYLDGDIIALNSIEPLWNINLEIDTPYAAAIDVRCQDITFQNAIDIPHSQYYCNNGVLLINIQCWRKEKLSQQCLDYIRRTKCRWMDQDAVNHVMGHRVRRLHLKYNLQMAFVRKPKNEWYVDKSFCNEIEEAIANPVILHFSEGEKPWQEKYSHANEWLKYKELSPWKNTPLFPAIIKPNAIWLMSEAYKVDADYLEKCAPAYFRFFSRTAKRHKVVFRLINKFLWLLGDLFGS